MPVKSCRKKGKKMFRIGSGPCVYPTKAKANRAYSAYRAKKHSGRK